MRDDSEKSPSSGRTGRQPQVGALLRMAYQVTRKHQLKALKARGFGDLNQALLNAMVYPHPDGVRPSDLAERINMTKQATNYLLGQLEALGYIERKAQKSSSRRLVFLTRRGWQSIDLHRAAVVEVEAQWAKAIGQKRFKDFKETLEQLVTLDIDAPGRTESSHAS
jgi:DNA-binding MarR family transcriptional regulator